MLCTRPKAVEFARRRTIARWLSSNLLRLTAAVLLLLVSVHGGPRLEAATIGKWGRHVVTLSNGTYSGNPFELEMDASFTHTSSGTQLTLPGYYAGNDTWKIGFMPTLIGEWTWTTSSTDPDLNGQSGSVDAVASTSLGMLKADTTHPAKWKYTDGDYVVPIGVFVQIMHGAGSTAEFNTFADFLQTNNLQLVNFRLCEQDICFSDVGALEMDLTLWDRLEERLEILSDRNLGVEIMLYTDDGGAPSYGAESATEKFLIRYMVARLAGFPNVLFNSGIDIWEYRGFTTWYDWYGNEVKQHDPYAHPVSSRPQNSEEESRMSESVRTYNGVGHRNSLLADLLLTFGHGEAASELDNWAEDQTGENGHTPADIRRAAWKATIAGGLAFHVRHNETNDCANGIIPNCDNPFTVTGIASQLDSEQWLTLVNPILQSTLGSTFGAMVPEPSLVANGYAISNPARTKILYFLMGVNDTWDLGNGGDLTLKLTGLIGTYDATWLDPRTGVQTSIDSFSGGSDYNLTPPSNDDWVLLLSSGSVDSRGRPRAPSNLRARLRGPRAVRLRWKDNSGDESGFSVHMKARPGRFEKVATVNPNVKRVVLTGLFPATTYAFRVRAWRGNRRSRFSNRVIVVTPSESSNSGYQRTPPRSAPGA